MKKVEIKDNKNKKKKKNKNEKDKRKNIEVIILLLILILISLIGITIARYQANINGKAFAQIANPVFEVRKEESLLLTALAPKASYVFEVRNYDQQDINEVDMEYYIEILSNTDKSITFELYNGENKIPIENNKTQKISLNKENKESHKYRLDIIYDKDEVKTEEDIKEKVEIKIHSIQKV